MDDARRRPGQRRPGVWLAGGLAGVLALPVAAAMPATDAPAAKDAGSRSVLHHDVDAARPAAAQPGAARPAAAQPGAARPGAETGAMEPDAVPRGATQSRAAQTGAPRNGAARTEAAAQAALAPGKPAVRLAPRESGAPPNAHPARLAPAALRAALQRVRVQGGAEPGPLFGARELDVLVGPLAHALANATPEQDVIFAVDVDAHSATAPGRITSARLFRRDGQLQLIVGRARQAPPPHDASGEPDGAPHSLRPGRRAAPVDPALQLAVVPHGGSLKRGDWVSLRPGPAGARTGEPAMAPQGRGLRPAPAGG